MAKKSLARQMRKQYCQLLPLLNGTAKYVERLLEDLPRHDFELQTCVKEYKRTVEKAKERHIKDLTELSDLVRGRLFFSENYTHDEVIDLLKSILKPDIKIKDIEWKKEIMEGLKYEGVIHMDTEIGDLNFELQIMPIEFKPYKPLLHKIYQKLRSDNPLTDKQKTFLKEVNNKVYKALDKKSKENRSESD